MSPKPVSGQLRVCRQSTNLFWFLSDAERFDHSPLGRRGDERYINQMFAQKPHLEFVRAQDSAHEKIISAIVAKFYRSACQLSSLTNHDLVCIEQA